MSPLLSHHPWRAFFALVFVIIPLLLVQGFNKTDNEDVAAASSPQANPLGHTYVPEAFIALPYNYHSATQMLYDAPRQRIYLASMGDLFSINLINQTATQITSIPEAAFVGKILLSDDGQVLYVVNTQSGFLRLYRLNANNWTMMNDYALPEIGGIELVDGRLFVTYAYQNKLEVWDAATGAVQQTLNPGTLETVGEPVASPDGNWLFTHGQTTLQQYNISTTPITLTLNANTAINLISQVKVSLDGSYLLASQYPGGQLTRFHTTDLSLLDTISIPSSYYTKDIAVGEGVFYGLSEDNASWSVLRAFDETTGQEVRSYRREQQGSNYYNKMVILDDGRVALHSSGSSAGNQIVVLTPADYGLVMPMVYGDYCFGPYTDDFSNPNSGWPVGTSGSITYRYITGEYSILHAQADRWGGATPGHTLEFLDRLEIYTRIVNHGDGLVGIIYGLNNDWSDFYTFEVWPSEQLWVNYHYTSAQGWQLIQYGQSPTIQTQGSNVINVYRHPGSSSLSLGINSSHTYFPPYVPGRFGVSAAAFETNMDFRYDNYKYVARGCQNSSAQPFALMSSPASLLPHPTTAEILEQVRD
jgi:hypothetical protein